MSLILRMLIICLGYVHNKNLNNQRTKYIIVRILVDWRYVVTKIIVWGNNLGHIMYQLICFLDKGGKLGIFSGHISLAWNQIWPLVYNLLIIGISFVDLSNKCAIWNLWLQLHFQKICEEKFCYNKVFLLLLPVFSDVLSCELGKLLWLLHLSGNANRDCIFSTAK